jgi:hypothetical protein
MKFNHKMFDLTDGGMVRLVGECDHCGTDYMCISVGGIVYPIELTDAFNRQGERWVDLHFEAEVHQGLVDLVAFSNAKGLEVVCEVHKIRGDLRIRGLWIKFPQAADRIELFARIADCVQEAFRVMVEEINEEP